MESRLEIVTPADDTLLVSIAMLRAAAGLAADDGSRDDELTALGNRASAEVVEACGISVGMGAEPTLRREQVRETYSAFGDEVLILARRHHVEIVAVSEDGVSITLDARSVDGEAGLLSRWVDGRKGCWRARETVVTYHAGFAIPPAGLAGVVADLVRIRLSEGSADPLVKAVTVDVEGVDSVRTDRWVGALPSGRSGGGLPSGFLARLERYINRQMR